MIRSRIAWLAACIALSSMAVGVAKEPPKHSEPTLPPEGVRALRDLEYIAGGHEENRLDLYLPEKSAHPLPLIVWIHGGGWRLGSKEVCPAVNFTTRGYAVASINYRLSQQAPFPAQIQDCKAAIRWLRRMPNNTVSTRITLPCGVIRRADTWWPWAPRAT